MQEMEETPVQSMGQEDPLEECMATHFSIPAWRIPWTEEPGRLQSTGVHTSVQLGHSVISDSSWPHGLQHTWLPYPSPTPRACSNSCPLSRWYHPIMSSSVVPFSPCLQSFPASGSFPIESVLPVRWPKCWSFSFSISPQSWAQLKQLSTQKQ